MGSKAARRLAPSTGGTKCSKKTRARSKKTRGKPRKSARVAMQALRKQGHATNSELESEEQLNDSTSVHLDNRQYSNMCTKMTLFKTFPTEIQAMVWRYALDEAPTVVEAVWNEDSQQFELLNSTSDILSVCGLEYLPKYYEPIYLYTRMYGPYSHVVEEVTPLYIRPDIDVLYLDPSLTYIGEPDCLWDPRNQVLQQLALNWTQVKGMSYPLKFLPTLNLKSLYVVGESHQYRQLDYLRDKSPEWEVYFANIPDLPENEDEDQWTPLQFDYLWENISPITPCRGVVFDTTHSTKIIGAVVERSRNGHLYTFTY